MDTLPPIVAKYFEYGVISCYTVSRFIQIKKKSYAEIILTNEIPPRCDISSRRVTIMSSRRVIPSWRHTSLVVISHCNFGFVGRNIMTGWHIMTRQDGILRRGGISLGSNISRKRYYSFYRPGPDCLWKGFCMKVWSDCPICHLEF